MDRTISTQKIKEVWHAYVEFRAQRVSPSTVARDYEKISKRIRLMESSTLSDSLAVREWFLDRYSPETARRSIEQLGAACRWGSLFGYLPSNPFEGLTRYLSERKLSESSWASFTSQERDLIIQVFESHHAFYSPWVRFLFWTGCRPEEAGALRWRHVASDFSEVLIHEAAPIDTGLTHATKNYKATRFPCNARLQGLLQTLKPYPCDKDLLVFRGIKGGRFDYKNFQSRYWKPLVEELADDGKIAFALSQYHCRHTFLTLALAAGMTIKDLSYLCRVSEAVLMKNYVQRARIIDVPEF